MLARTGGVAGSTTTSQAGSPSRPKKSYFDDIPTSSPGGALSRDPEMEEGDADMDLAESLFGSAAPVPNAGPSTSRNQPQHHMSRPMTTSEAGFNDMDLTFDLEEEDDFDLDAEAEAAMREMDAMNDDDDAFFNAGAPKKVMASTKGKQAETGGHRRSISTTANSVIDFYANPRASERRVKEGKSVAQDRNGPSSTSAPSRNEEDLDHLEEDENFDDFDFGNEEEDIMREMELAEKKQRDREAAALAAERRAAESVHSATAGASNTSIDNVASTSSSKTPSLTTSSSAQEVDLDLDDAFDEDFLKSIDEAEQLSSPQKNVSVAPAAEVADDALISTATSPSKLPKTTTEISQVAPEDAAHPQLVEEEEEDLYS